jgi:hypothetical protein
LDDTDAYFRFAHIGPRDHLGACHHLLSAVLFDAGYVGLDKYWSIAVIKQRRVPGEPRFDWSDLMRIEPAWSASSDASCALSFRDDSVRLEWSKPELSAMPHVRPC